MTYFYDNNAGITAVSKSGQDIADPMLSNCPHAL
jgi:hypothetical protein